MNTLRPYQERAINDIRKNIQQGYTKIGLMLPTGAGKTTVATEIIQRAVAKGKRVGFIVDKIDLLEQTSEVFDNIGIDHGVIQADHYRQNYSKNVQVCSVQTLGRRRFPEFDICIVDEFHSMYEAQLRIMARHPGIYIGLSATPFSKGLGSHWQTLVVGATTKELISEGYLSDFVVYGPPVPDLSKVRTIAGEYNQKQLAEIVDQRQPVGNVVKTWHKYGKHRQTIVFCVNIAHSKHIARGFENSGVSAIHIDAYTDKEERRNAIRAYREGRVQVLCCVDILTKGFDAPETSCVVMARPTKSLIVHLQQIGRGLRTAPGKDDAVILDHGGNVARHGFPTDDVLPTDMNIDSRHTSETRSNTKDREKLPRSCPNCYFMVPADQWVCPECGHKPERQNSVEHTEGELKKLNKFSMEDKQKWYSMLLFHCQDKGYSSGWVAHKYREKFGVWPKGMRDTIQIPDEEVVNYIKYLNIKNAKRRKR